MSGRRVWRPGWRRLGFWKRSELERGFEVEGTFQV
jgi:hypothetical protein